MNPRVIETPEELKSLEGQEIAIGDCVRAFQAALPGAEIYVYDNNSRDRTAEVAREAGWSEEAIEALYDAGAIFEPHHSRAHLRDGGVALATQ